MVFIGLQLMESYTDTINKKISQRYMVDNFSVIYLLYHS